ncbi:hypothetical protein [Adhaeretor mobilis]|uniref:Uncharacterized protein n=1 Tax=Adhaeretor mobilis TaxID=1930276 RepID=A0A517N375_9BACT|nr:hypothetical protein [Adhaeretor mobilis]QDT01584.1 hypothetical protein HG15A2_49310 [Adhaeretor mobilis]
MSTFSLSRPARDRFFVAIAALVLLAQEAIAAPLNPSNFTSFGVLPPGDFTIDTDALTFNGSSGGVLVSQGGGAPDIAVFTFDGGSTLANGDAISVTGGNALALLFQGSVILSGTIDVSGADGTDQAPGGFTGIGGLGIAGGGRGGNGGPFSFGQDGIGPGHGVAGSSSAAVSGAGSGAGAGFGTGGGNGGVGVTNRPGGLPYGDPLHDLLFAGSGGGGGGGASSGSQRLGGGGGAGGGALEIGALTSLQLNGASILANGGHAGEGFTDGGGGSGGGILLHAFDVNLDPTALIQANGGNGGSVTNTGGCGGAGRIELIHHPSGSFESLGTIEALAGSVNSVCADGEHVVTESTEVGVPEPSSLCIFFIASIVFTSPRRKPRGWQRRNTPKG